MNINVPTNIHEGAGVPNVIERAKKLYESYRRCQNEAQFIHENGDTPEMHSMYSFIGLNETMSDASKQFHFENGMGIPGFGLKSNSKYTLSGISKTSANVEEFVKTVDNEICKKFLLFSMSDKDKEKLKEAYNAAMQSRLD